VERYEFAAYFKDEEWKGIGVFFIVKLMHGKTLYCLTTAYLNVDVDIEISSEWLIGLGEGKYA